MPPGTAINLTPPQAMEAAERLRRAGRPAEAEALYRRLLAAAPNFHPAYHALGLLALEAGRLPLAVELTVKAVSLDPSMAMYHRNLGEMCRRLGRLDEAVAAGRRATELSPGDFDAHYNLGLALADGGHWDEAIRHYRRALEINPGHGFSWNNLGAALDKSGDTAAAEQAYAKACALNPRHAEAQNNLGAIYSAQGRLDEARACFEAAIDAQPDFAEPHYNISSLKTYRADDPHLAALEASVRKNIALPPPARARFWFALGKAREDAGRYDEAFAAYAAGNRVQHALLPVDEARYETRLQRIMAIFDRAFFEARRDVTGAEATPIFIVGMPRSGTSLLEQILSSHPGVHGAGELIDLHETMLGAPGAGPERRYPDFIPDLGAEDFTRLGRAYAERVWKLAPDARWITDKMPANFLYLGAIHLMLPRAKVIHAMRDPMDSCFSCYAKLFNDSMEWCYDLGTLGRYYERYIKLIRHWRAVLPADAFLDLRYEELVADLPGQARRVLDFIGMPWDDKCLAFHENRRHVKTASVAQVRQPLYNTSVARWEKFRSHLQPLLDIVGPYREPPPAP